jgi:hypothetical protein
MREDGKGPRLSGSDDNIMGTAVQDGLDPAEIKAWRGEVLAGYLNFRRIPHGGINWITAIAGAMPVMLDEDRTVWTAKVIADMKEEWRKRVKKKLPGLRWRGTFEMDLLHPKTIRSRPHKVRLLEDLGVDAQASPHF